MHLFMYPTTEIPINYTANIECVRRQGRYQDAWDVVDFFSSEALLCMPGNKPSFFLWIRVAATPHNPQLIKTPQKKIWNHSITCK